MSKDIFDRREQAFESVFFAKLDEQKIAAMRARRDREAAISELSEATGIEDESVLQHILDLGIQPQNLRALSLVPLVITAWASGEVTPSERKAALQAVREQGVTEDSVAYELFEAWLDHELDPDLESTWAEYMKEVLAKMDAAKARTLRNDLMTRCRKIAEASGGFLGLGSVSDAEEAAMRRLESAMS